MAKDTKVQAKIETFVADPPQTLLESEVLPAPAPRMSWSARILSKTSKLSRSTQFIIAATLILSLTMVFVGQLVSERIQRAALQSAAEAGAYYMEAFLEPYVQEMSLSNELSEKSVKALDQLMQSRSLKHHIVSIKIWRADGTIIYSTDKSITLHQFPIDEIAEALKGTVVTDLGNLDKEENEFERERHVPLYEVYAPLREFGSGRVIAVGEFYVMAEGLVQEISRARQQVWLVVSAANLAMLTLLFFFVRRGDKIIHHQQVTLRARLLEQDRLHAKNAALQRKISNATEEFSHINELTLRRTGAELHDGPAQLLTLILIRLDDLGEDDSRVDHETLEAIRRAASDALREVRDLSLGMALPELNDLSLTEELHLVVQRHEQRTGTRVALHLDKLPIVAPLPLKLCIYRFVQETLNNAYRHAAGQGQSIRASYLNGVLLISVKDSGPGMASNAMVVETEGRARLGLVGLRYRVESLGGLFTIEPSLVMGTTVKAQFKL